MSENQSDGTNKAQKMRADLLRDLERLKSLLPGRGTKGQILALPRVSHRKSKNLPRISNSQISPRTGILSKNLTPPIPPESNLSTFSPEYYIEVFGFDPIHEQKKISRGYKYEQFYALQKDLELEREGISIGARVEVIDHGKTIKNRIIFAKGKREASVNCVHTALFSLEAAQALVASEDEILDLARTSEQEPVELPAEDHFVSLRSYVEGIATFGVRNIIGASYYSEEINPETLPFGFNSAMQRQILKALHQIAPSATQGLIREALLDLVEVVTPDWFDSRVSLLDHLYNIKEIVLTDPAVFEAIDNIVASRNLRILAAKYPNTDPAIRELLSQDENYSDYLSAPSPIFENAPGERGPQYVFKIAIIGAEGSGRNTICRSFSGHFRDPLAKSLEYIGASFGFRDFYFQVGESVRLLLCNFSGKERFQYILPDYSLGAAGVIICYDVTSLATFQLIPKLVGLAREKNPEILVYLIGCKFDRDPAEHEVNQEMANILVQELGCVQNMMTSAQTGYNVEEALSNIAESLLRNVV